MQTIYPSDCPKVCDVWFSADRDGAITARIEKHEVAADGQRYMLWSEEAVNCPVFPDSCAALERAGWRIEHVANIRITGDQLWQLKPIEVPV